jgi:hypothetical protein
LNDIVTDIEATGDHVSQVLGNVPTSPINVTIVNYEDDKAVVKAVQTRLHELDDQIDFLNSYVGDAGT